MNSWMNEFWARGHHCWLWVRTCSDRQNCPRLHRQWTWSRAARFKPRSGVYISQFMASIALSFLTQFKSLLLFLNSTSYFSREKEKSGVRCLFDSGNMHYDGMNTIIRRDIFKTLQLIITLLGQSSASTVNSHLTLLSFSPFNWVQEKVSIIARGNHWLHFFLLEGGIKHSVSKNSLKRLVSFRVVL